LCDDAFTGRVLLRCEVVGLNNRILAVQKATVRRLAGAPGAYLIGESRLSHYLRVSLPSPSMGEVWSLLGQPWASVLDETQHSDRLRVGATVSRSRAVIDLLFLIEVEAALLSVAVVAILLLRCARLPQVWRRRPSQRW